jgi:hypothetical protein
MPPHSRLGPTALFAGLVVLTLACGAIDGSPSATATPNASEVLAREIAAAYGQMLLEARAIVEPRPAAPEAKELLRLLGEEYKVQFGNFACLLADQSQDERAAVSGAFDEARESFLPADMAWLEDAAGDYDLEDVEIRDYLEALRTLDDYAFPERLAASRPGEELLCG